MSDLPFRITVKLIERIIMKTIEPRTLKGFRDYGAKEQVARQAMFAKIQTVFERFGFLPLSTPVLEYKEILMGKYGDDEKLVYSFKDNGDRDVAMRYDLTVPLARYVAQNQNSLQFPFKRYQIAPVWRAENTQKGRLREFYQCDIDTIGTNSPLADAEVIACVCAVLDALGIGEYQIQINDRRIFTIFDGANTVDIIRAIDKLDKIGKDGVLAELAQKNIAPETMKKVEWFVDLAQGETAQLGDEMTQGPLKEVWDALQALQLNLKKLGVDWVKIKFNPTIARGLDYYTSTVFETKLLNAPEFGSIASGGRYDGLVNTFSEQSFPAVGFSIGIDRLFEALETLGVLQTNQTIQVLVLNQDQDLVDEYLSIVSMLRRAGINSEFYYDTVKLDKQFKYAENKNIPFTILCGANEQARGVVQLKTLAAREQVEVSLEEAVQLLRQR